MFMRELEEEAAYGWLNVEKLYYEMREEERKNYDLLGNIVFYKKLIEECDVVADEVKTLLEAHDLRKSPFYRPDEQFYRKYNPLIKHIEEKTRDFDFFSDKLDTLAKQLQNEFEESPAQKIFDVSEELRNYSFEKYGEIEHNISVSFETEESDLEEEEQARDEIFQSLYIYTNIRNPPQEFLNILDKFKEMSFSLNKLSHSIIGVTEKYVRLRWLGDLHRKATDLGLLEGVSKKRNSEKKLIDSSRNIKDYQAKPTSGKKFFAFLCMPIIFLLAYSAFPSVRHKANNELLFFIPPTLNSLAVSNILSNITNLSRPKTSSVRKSSIDKGDYVTFSRNLSTVFPVESTMHLLKQCEAGYLNCQSGIPLDVLVEKAKSFGKLDVLQSVINNKMGEIIGIGINPHYVFVVEEDGTYILKK